MTNATDKVRVLLEHLSPPEKREVMAFIRQTEPIHALEGRWNTSAEAILDAIAESTDLIQRGIRGVLADRAFHTCVVPALVHRGWTSVPVVGDQRFDAVLDDGLGAVSVQVKLQRRLKGVPMFARSRFFPAGDNYWNVEVQKTRKGHDAEGNLTRPYRFGDFDILAVNLHPSSGDWSHFRYTVASWLIPDRVDPAVIHKYQPVPFTAAEGWSDDFETCVGWLRSGERRLIGFDNRP